MSWLNNSLNSIKGQLTTLAQEVLAETAGPGDEEFRGTRDVDVDTKTTTIDLLAETKAEKEKLDVLCQERELEIERLRKQINELQFKFNESGGGAITAAESNANVTTGSPAEYSSKSPTTDNNATLEDSWCWTPDNNKHDHDHCSETSSANGNEMVNITLEDVQTSSTATSSIGKRAIKAVELQKRVQELETENEKLNVALEELDNQHNQAMQNMLELKGTLQNQLTTVTKSYEDLKKEHADAFIKHELELGKLTKQLEQMHRCQNELVTDHQSLQKQLDFYQERLADNVTEICDLQELLKKKSGDNEELIERIRAVKHEHEHSEDERKNLLAKIDELTKELETVSRNVKEKKNSESSSSSIGKHSEDEFIVVRDGDASSSGPSTPPNKEELKNKIVELENRVSELTIENGTLTTKMQDYINDRERISNQHRSELNKLSEIVQQKEKEIDQMQKVLNDLLSKYKNDAANESVANEQLKLLTADKQKVECEINKLQADLEVALKLEKRLLICEQEKEALQVELHGLREAREQVTQLESKMQKLILDNQEFKLNAEAETEAYYNSAELETKLKSLKLENKTLRNEINALTQAKFREAIAEEKQEITDLDDEEPPLNLEKLRTVIEAHIKLKPKVDITGIENIEQWWEKTFRQLRDRLWKINDLEKNLTQMSEEVIDLQDSKIVWHHEKKTLEADISQYILQCNELMKNNEILLNELENYKRNKLEPIPENNEENIVQLESQLEECTKLNRTLEEEYSELNERIEELDNEKSKLTEKLRESQHAYDALKQKEKDFQLKIENLELEKCNLQFELNELKTIEEKSTNDNETNEKYQILKNQLEILSKDHEDLIAAMHAQKATFAEVNSKRDLAETTTKEFELIIAAMKEKLREREQAQEINKEEVANLHGQIKTNEQQYEAEILQKNNQIKELQKLQNEIIENNNSTLKMLEELKTQKLEMQEKFKELKINKQELEQELLQQKTIIEKLQNQLNDNEISLNNLKTEKLHFEEKLLELTTLNNTQLNELQALKEELLNKKTTSIESPESLERIAKLEMQLLATSDLQKTVDTLNYEKGELIKALQQKHAENMQYYLEIQRLQPLVQELQQQQQQLTSTINEQQKMNCEKCQVNDTIIIDLRKELEKSQDQINFLKEKSNILTTNLLTEQTNQKSIQDEKNDVEEQNANLKRSLERLREHLLEMEEMHTQETIELQKELGEMKDRMFTLQDEVSHSNNAYTSASIRANQHAETLQAQHALVVQQRDEILAKLSAYEDRELKNQAALCNLQCALEQFQNDKENDIKSATQRIRKELQQELNQKKQLQEQISSLNQQLIDANQGLRAAARLSDQLESSQHNISALREEVETINRQKLELAEKLKSNETSQSDKVEKILIKSLLIGYVVSTNQNDKNQVLRLISSVLDFTPSETDRVGLNKQQSSWLGAILGTGTGQGGSQNRDNLVQAFVQFLEQESQPKPDASQMPNLLDITKASPQGQSTAASAVSPGSRRTSIGSNGSNQTTNQSAVKPIPIQLFDSHILDDFQPTRNSSSILKSILHDY